MIEPWLVGAIVGLSWGTYCAVSVPALVYLCCYAEDDMLDDDIEST